MLKLINTPTILITGSAGRYDKTEIKNPSVKYGRNAASDFCAYRKRLWMGYRDSSTMPEFAYKYSPHYSVDKLALVGNAYETLKANNESGKFDGELRVADIDNKYKNSGNVHTSVEALDLNEDGKLDVKEMAVCVMAQDALSSNSDKPVDVKYIAEKFTDGMINNRGYERVLGMLDKDKVEESREIFRHVAENSDIDEAVKEFYSDKNNTLEAVSI